MLEGADGLPLLHAGGPVFHANWLIGRLIVMDGFSWRY